LSFPETIITKNDILQAQISMDNQIWSTLELVFEIFQSTFFFIFVYGMKAMTFLTNIVNTTMNDDGWLTKLALTALIILATLQALRMAYRGIMFWIRFVFNFAFVVGSIAIMVWLWSRGFDGAYEDLSILAQFWTEQYRRYESQAKASKAMYDVLRSTRDAVVNERQRAERMQGGRRW
jgi:hypothetical protein